jgi:hypothetical protein
MRVLIALLAVLGLLANPASAAVSMARCAHAAASQPMVDMSAMPGMDRAVARDGYDPAVWHDKTGKICAQVCAAACSIPTVLAGPRLNVPLMLAPAPRNPTRLAALHTYEPPGTEPPPKS